MKAGATPSTRFDEREPSRVLYKDDYSVLIFHPSNAIYPPPRTTDAMLEKLKTEHIRKASETKKLK